MNEFCFYVLIETLKIIIQRDVLRTLQRRWS